MKVYRIRLDVNNHQWILPRDELDFDSDILRFDCQPKGSGWQSPDLYIFNPKLKKGNFFNIYPGGLILNSTPLLYPYFISSFRVS
ncbi:hypothetical protein B9G39_01385 [Zooshikella ganghwensis]|uniref:Uncharacterized protein n=1 Tax=Zooshikella ganghwensis TaxID=202772 RepID=A0A4P9VGK4_9GAMM|nr:hypothetical protein B9G39_01385 [Zooshikella ganghwensis]